ncbi:MAG: hypothetical protein ACF8NJ_03405 [Phycisphaerales bacterium JB038]
MIDRDEYLDGLGGFHEMDDADDALLDEEDREAEEAIASWLHSRSEAAATESTAEEAGPPAAPITVQFDETTSVDGDLYMDCLTMFLLTQLDFELEAQSAAAGADEVVLPDDRWQVQGEGMVPESFRERLLRAQWKVEQQWRLGLHQPPTPDDDYETQSRRFFNTLAERGVCRVIEIESYENPFEGMRPMDFGDFPEDFDDDCPM